MAAGSPVAVAVAVRNRRREWLLLLLSVAVLLAIVVPPLVNVGRYQHRIALAMSNSLGRPVRMRSVSLRLLPTPALVLSDVAIEEAPAFGAEPALRAPSLVATLRLASLWRGRLEISRVEISDASINLVRDRFGHWNIGSIVLQASHVSNAPTAQRTAGPAPRFPYVQITDARINMKREAEKLPYTLEGVDLSFWLAEPDQWRLRLEGQPVRTDLVLGLSDTGTLHIDGTLHRATALGRMPVALHVDWDRVPLGQASRLLLARDSGWRGEAHLLADLVGDLDDLAFKTHLDLEELHREEWVPTEPFPVRSTCTGHYSRAGALLDSLHCEVPVRDGSLVLTGSVGGSTALHLTAQQLPAAFLLNSARLLAHGQLPAELGAGGAFDGTLDLRSPETPAISGSLLAPRLDIALSSGYPPLTLEEVTLGFSAPGVLSVSARPLALGGDRPLALDAQFTRSGYTLHAAGGAALTRLDQIGYTLPAGLVTSGRAELDLTRTGLWESPRAVPVAASAIAETGMPTTAGWLRLRNARFTAPQFAEQVLLPRLEANWLPSGVVWSAPDASYAGTAFSLTAELPASCAGNSPCPVHFRASAQRLDAVALRDALLHSPTPDTRTPALLSNLLSRFSHAAASAWPPLTGELRAGTLTAGTLLLRNAVASISLDPSATHIEQLDAQTMGGLLHASATVTWGPDHTPHTHLEGTLTHANAAEVGTTLHENWGPGTLDLWAALDMAGGDRTALEDSAAGAVRAEWVHGALGTGTSLAHFARWDATGTLAHRSVTLGSSDLTAASNATPVPVSGTLGLDRTLDLILNPSTSEPEKLTGTLAHPTRAAGTEAAR